MKKQSSGRTQVVEGGRSVFLGPYPDTSDFVIQFQRPIRKTDFNNGQILQSGKAVRRRNSILNQIRISQESAYALWILLNEHFAVADTDKKIHTTNVE